MKRVTGLGGVFFKCHDKNQMLNWYRLHLGIEAEEWGVVFPLEQSLKQHPASYNVWSLFKENTSYFAPSHSTFMINFTVENLNELLKQLKLEGAEVMEQREDNDFGKFGWIIDPEGNKIELWEPKS